jgi:hypothetical protein
MQRRQVCRDSDAELSRRADARRRSRRAGPWRLTRRPRVHGTGATAPSYRQIGPRRSPSIYAVKNIGGDPRELARRQGDVLEAVDGLKSVVRQRGARNRHLRLALADAHLRVGVQRDVLSARREWQPHRARASPFAASRQRRTEAAHFDSGWPRAWSSGRSVPPGRRGMRSRAKLAEYLGHEVGNL